METIPRSRDFWQSKHDDISLPPDLVPTCLLTEKYWSGSAYSLGLNDNFDPSLAGKQPVEYPLVAEYRHKKRGVNYQEPTA